MIDDMMIDDMMAYYMIDDSERARESLQMARICQGGSDAKCEHVADYCNTCSDFWG